MKKTILFLSLVCLSISILPAQLSAKNNHAKTEMVTDKKALPENIRILVNRIEVIQKMDMSALNSNEKIKLSEELKSIRQKLAATDGGIYLSIGAVIIILLLLLIIL